LAALIDAMVSLARGDPAIRRVVSDRSRRTLANRLTRHREAIFLCTTEALAEATAFANKNRLAMPPPHPMMVDHARRVRKLWAARQLAKTIDPRPKDMLRAVQSLQLTAKGLSGLQGEGDPDKGP
jgi:hypothetical protein